MAGAGKRLPIQIAAVVVHGGMAIDKESTGMPEIDVHRRTTKVNFGTALGVTLFLLVMAAVIIWLSRQNGG